MSVVHDYVTQKGGAERVALLLAEQFGGQLHTTLYDRASTFPEFRDIDVHTTFLNRFGLLRRHHRLALPILPFAISRLKVDAAVTIASSSGWAHGAHFSGRSVVYCYAPARWLYQSSRYLGSRKSATTFTQRVRFAVTTAAVRVLGAPLRRWDRAAAKRVSRYVAISSVTRDAIRRVYGREAEVVPAPYTLDINGHREPVEIHGPFYLCIARLLPYKNVDVIVEAFRELDLGLVVVGGGPEFERLSALATAHPNIRLLGRLSDDQLRWLYASCRGVVAASYEDFGLSPVEAAAFGKPAVVLRAGGYLDTVASGRTGIFFDEPTPEAISRAVRDAELRTWDEAAIRRHSARFTAEAFVERMRRIVDEEARRHDKADHSSVAG